MSQEKVEAPIPGKILSVEVKAGSKSGRGGDHIVRPGIYEDGKSHSGAGKRHSRGGQSDPRTNRPGR